MRARLRRIPVPLLVLLAIAALEALGWAVATAPLDGPDESAHVSYVQNLAERGRAPSFAGGDGTESTEVASALNWVTLRSDIGVPTIKPSSSPADEAAWRAIEKSLTADARKNAGGPNAVAKNPPLYYLWESVPYRIGRSWPLFDRLFLMRIANALLFMGTVLFAWLAAGELWSDLWRRTALTAFVTLQPQLAFMGGVVNPDTLLTLVWTAFVFVALRLVVRGPTFGRVVGLLAAVAASGLTQGRGLPLIPAAAIVLGLALWRHRPVRMPTLAGAGVGALIMGGALIVYRATLGAGSKAYGAEIAFRSPRPFSLWEYVSQTWQFYLPKLPGMRPWLGPSYHARQLWDETFWGTFGSLDVHFSPQVYDVLQAVMVCLAIGALIALVIRRSTVRWDVVAVLAVTVLGLVLFLHLASYRNLLGTDDPLLVGRYLLPLVVPIGAAFIFVFDLLPRRNAIYGMTALLSAEAFLGLSGLALSLVRFYG